MKTPGVSTLRRRRVFSAAVASVLLVGLVGSAATLVSVSGCAPAPPAPAASSAAIATPTAAPPPSPSQAPAVPTSTLYQATPTLCEPTPADSYMLAQPTPQNIIGGGPAQSGPFTFTLFLYRDERFAPVTWVAPWCYSDIPGVGVYMDWVYHGPPISGPVEVSWGPESELSYTDTLQCECAGDGFHVGRAGGGILLPADASPGDTASWVMMVETPQGCYGAALRFVLVEGAEGFALTNISMDALTPQQLRKLCQ